LLKVDVTKLPLDAVDLWMNQWLLLTAGTLDDCNMMTVAWGSIGCMWSKPFAQIVVRPVLCNFSPSLPEIVPSVIRSLRYSSGKAHRVNESDCSIYL